jgi:iron-sulfur cluster assembly accessory protein
MSVPYLAGATIDFADTIEKQGFTIDNPNAHGSCACGDSFH